MRRRKPTVGLYGEFQTMLEKPAAFFEALRTGLLGPTLSADEVSGCNAIRAACEGWALCWTAYALATSYHETAHTMQPIKEYGGDAYFRRMYDIEGNNPAKAKELGNMHPGDGARYAGRGYVQLTGRANYARADRELHDMGVLRPTEDLVADPDLMLRPHIAAATMRHGMEEGWFTGRTMSDFLGDGLASRSDFRQARRIINGIDRADLIAGYAEQFQQALVAGDWM